MPAARIPLSRIELAIREVCNCLGDKRGCSSAWESMNEKDLWRELVACILGSRVRFEVAHSAMDRMDEAGLFARAPDIRRSVCYEQDVLRALSGHNDAHDGRTNAKGYPFSKVRSKQIRAAAESLYSNGSDIRSLLDKARHVREARRHLATDVAGLGPKQASLFLRNIGYAAHVAVLDVHVLTYMAWAGLTPSPVTTVRTIRQYEMLEDAFIEHSCSSGFPPDRFDLAVWVVVRVVKREHKLCR